MIQVNIHEAKTQLSALLRRVALGEEFLIARSGKPVAKLTPLDFDRRARFPGGDRGAFTISEDFDAPLPDEVLRDFESWS